MLLQYRISLCWEQQRGRDMELMVDRATLLHIGFSTPSEEGGYIQRQEALILVYFSALKGSRLTTIASCALRTTTQCEGMSGELLVSLCGAKGGT